MINMHLSIDLNDDNLVLKLVDTGKSYKYVLKGIKFIVQKIKCLDSFMLEFEKRLASSPANYQLNNFVYRSFIVPEHVRTFNQVDLCQNSFCPEYLYLALSTQDSAAGSLDSSIFDFRPHNVSEIKVTLENEPYPSLNFAINWSEVDGSHLRPYLSLFGEDLGWNSAGCFIDRRRYLKGYTFYRIDISSRGCLSENIPRKMGNLKLTIDFSTNENPCLKLSVWSSSTDFLQIDASRAVLKSY